MGGVIWKDRIHDRDTEKSKFKVKTGEHRGGREHRERQFGLGSAPMLTYGFLAFLCVSVPLW
jgi:hypothetical protein